MIVASESRIDSGGRIPASVADHVEGGIKTVRTADTGGPGDMGIIDGNCGLIIDVGAWA